MNNFWKKLLAVTLLMPAAAGVFGQSSVSAGGGIFTDMSFFNGYKLGKINLGYRNLGFSAYGFFDAVYAEFGAGLGYGMMSKVVKRGDVPGKPDFGDFIQLDLSIMGKFPFRVKSVTLFPLAGVSYKCILFGKDPDVIKLDYKKREFNQFGLLGGFGLDYDFNDSLFFRTEGLFHFRFPMNFIDDLLPQGASITYGMGGRMKVAIGRKF